MPAVSKKQAMAMNIAKAVQGGKATATPGSPSAEIAGSMAPSDVADFATTPQKGLPTRVRKPGPKNVAPRPPGPPPGGGGMNIPVKNVGGPPVQQMPMPRAKGGAVKKGGC